MSRGAWGFKQTDLTRALKALQAARVPIETVTVDPRDGRITITVREEEKAAARMSAPLKFA
jgi:VCBS repeat-containing protein